MSTKSKIDVPHFMPKIGKYFRLCILILAHVCIVLLLSGSKVRGIADMDENLCKQSTCARKEREWLCSEKKKLKSHSHVAEAKIKCTEKTRYVIG